MRPVTTRLALLALMAVAAGCDKTVTAPSAPGAGAHKAILSSPVSVSVVTRNTALATAQSASAVIGLLGGRLTLPGAGLTVVIPPFALTSPTRITVTAVAGNQLAYEFAPHGIRFLAPLVVTQSLLGTSALSGGLLPKPLIAGYFASLSDLDPLAGTAQVSEILGTSVNLQTGTVTFPVVHFSGYLVATGDDRDASTAGSNQ
ncbi:MAG TPA: hypothetical protein VFO55_07440 [Gemmatimonadaceae bacterium]|nr:hypothetical protein [Gemmatimonadaceae bacterium]